jgi:predicted Zn-dependent protease
MGLAAGMMVLLILPALIGGSGCAVNPATGKKQISIVSRSQEIQMGREGDREILNHFGAYGDTSLAEYVERVGQRLAAVSELPNLEWHFRVLNSPVVNAFALPGGYIYVSRGILALLNSEAQLAGVIGHEIGHVTARHTAQRITQSQLAQIGLGLGMILIPDFGRYTPMASRAGHPLFRQGGLRPASGPGDLCRPGENQSEADQHAAGLSIDAPGSRRS